MKKSIGQKSFEYEGAVIHYEKFGHGPKNMLSFHGFGQNNDQFRKIAQALQDEYTFYSFDLFFHGTSFWNKKDSPISKDFWLEMIRLFMVSQKIEKCALMSFSMGARFALTIVEGLPSKVDGLILIAPDGIKRNIFYKMATSPSFFRKLFRGVIINPALFKQLTKLVYTLHITDKSIIKFVETQMDTREKRRRVYYSWTVFRRLRFSNKVIADTINKYQIPTTMFLGQYDKMMTANHMAPLINLINNSHLYTLNAGHSNLMNAVAAYYEEQYPQQSKAV